MKHARYPWLTIYGTLAMAFAVIVTALTVVATAATFLVVSEARGADVAAVSSALVMVLGLAVAASIGVVADVARWRQDLIEIQHEQRELLRHRNPSVD